MDEIDRKILCELQQNAAIANQELAARVGLSPCALRHRQMAVSYSATPAGFCSAVDAASIFSMER